MSRGRWGTGKRWVLAGVATAASTVLMGSSPGAASAAPAAPVHPPVSLPGDGHLSPNVGASSGIARGRTAPTANSLDWAGYAVTGPIVTSVSGSWDQPAVACSGRKAQQSAFWVGIDGYAASDPTVQQVGTDSDCTKGSKKHPGGAVYYAWFEMYPASLVVLPPASYPVTSGDVLSASVSGTGVDYVLSISDAGRWSFTTNEIAAPVPLAASAEWIAEAPTACTAGRCKAQPLADFGSVAFHGATVNNGAVNAPGQTDTQITMSKNKKGTIVKAATTALDPTGRDFTVTWLQN